jgi:hypothetical protein
MLVIQKTEIERIVVFFFLLRQKVTETPSPFIKSLMWWYTPVISAMQEA